MPRIAPLTVLSASAAAALALCAGARADTTISGTVANSVRAEVHIAGPSERAVVAGSSGEYLIATVHEGYYTVAPREESTGFTPAALFKRVGSAAVSGVDFAGVPTTAPKYKIAGTISGAFAPGAMITLNGANVASVGTDGGGTYSISGLAAGTYTVSASQPGYGFSKSRTVTITNTDAVENGFVATATPAGAALAVTAVAHLPQATVGVAYSSSVLKSIAGGTGTYHYQSGPYDTGTPPPGMLVTTAGVLSGTPTKSGTYAFELCATNSYGVVSSTCAPTTVTVGTTPVGTPVPPTPTPPSPTPPAPTANTSWVYYNGVFDWPGDYSFAASADYGDTSGSPMSGAHDIKITSNAWGGWLPYALNWNFNAAPYSKLTFSLKPTRTDQTWQVYFVKVGDIPVGIAIDVTQYGPTPVAGQWGTYTVPLSVLGVAGTSIYKFAIQDQTGANGNTWYVDNVGFTN
jgi:hypothetical protein